MSLNNNNSNWLSKIKINEEPSPFRNVNFPSPPKKGAKKNENYTLLPEPELTEEQKKLIEEDPAGYLTLPSTIYEGFQPHYIHSQHYGECATDSFLNILFFADGFRNYFARKADKIYKQLKNEHRNDLIRYTEFFKQEVKNKFSLVKQKNISTEQFDQIVDIFARIVRRFIFVRLLEIAGSRASSKLSEIIETSCPVTVKPVAVRRKSINAMAGVDIHDAILEFLGLGKRERKENGIVGKGLATTDVLKLVNTFMDAVMAPSSTNLYYHWHPFEETNAIEPHLHLLKAVYLAPASTQPNEPGHAVGLFRSFNKWLLADNNLGQVIPLVDFEPEKYFGPGVLARFFIGDFQEIDANQFLDGNHGVKPGGYYGSLDTYVYSARQINRLKKSTFYGFYVYVNGDKDAGANQIVIAMAPEKNMYPCHPMREAFDSDQRIYFFSRSDSDNDYENWFRNLNEEVEERNPNLPGPLKRTALKKSKHRGKPKGRRRTTQRAKPPRANRTNNLLGQAQNVFDAGNNTKNNWYSNYANLYSNYGENEPAKPKRYTLKNHLAKTLGLEPSPEPPAPAYSNYGTNNNFYNNGNNNNYSDPNTYNYRPYGWSVSTNGY